MRVMARLVNMYPSHRVIGENTTGDHIIGLWNPFHWYSHLDMITFHSVHYIAQYNLIFPCGPKQKGGSDQVIGLGLGHRTYGSFAPMHRLTAI